MEWTIDTGVLGAAGCDAKDLAKVLEAALSQHAKTTPEQASTAVIEALPAEVRKDASAMMNAMPVALAAADAVKAKLPPIQEQMRVGIKAACLLADNMGGNVTVTISGHHIRDHKTGIFKRMRVSVDRAAPTED